MRTERERTIILVFRTHLLLVRQHRAAWSTLRTELELFPLRPTPEASDLRSWLILRSVFVRVQHPSAGVMVALSLFACDSPPEISDSEGDLADEAALVALREDAPEAWAACEAAAEAHAEAYRRLKAAAPDALANYETVHVIRLATTQSVLDLGKGLELGYVAEFNHRREDPIAHEAEMPQRAARQRFIEARVAAYDAAISSYARLRAAAEEELTTYHATHEAVHAAGLWLLATATEENADREADDVCPLRAPSLPVTVPWPEPE